jgi:signal transduction histidine kinase
VAAVEKGGIAFDALRAEFGLCHKDSAVALLVPPVYILLMLLNLGLVATTVPGLSRQARRRVFRESGTPMIPLELLSAVMAATAVLLWAHFGLVAVVGLLAVLVVTIVLPRMLGSALQTGDDLVALRDVSDQRAAEVARLSSDRDRLLSEVLSAEQHERARPAESLHDGPMQRLVALREDLGEPDGAGRHRRSLLLPLAQELVVNAVKRARPTAIDVLVQIEDGQIVLEVNDEGVCMDAETSRVVQAEHLCLAMVRRRVEDAGGTLDIATRADGGTRSRVVLPQGENGNGPGLNARGHSLDACSITSSAHPP